LTEAITETMLAGDDAGLRVFCRLNGSS